MDEGMISLQLWYPYALCLCSNEVRPLILTIVLGEILVNGFVHTDLSDELPSGKRLARSTKK